jgi:hypothetical protein
MKATFLGEENTLRASTYHLLFSYSLTAVDTLFPQHLAPSCLALSTRFETKVFAFAQYAIIVHYADHRLAAAGYLDTLRDA